MQPISILFPFVFVVFSGFICAKLNWFSEPQIHGLRKFFFNIAIPLFLFLSMYQADLDKALSTTVMASFYLPVILCYVCTLLLCKVLCKKPLVDSAVLALGGTYSNTVLVGLPLIMASLGPHYGAMVFMIITFHSALLFSLTFLISSAQHTRLKLVIKPLLLNPIVISITGGLITNLLSVPIPSIALTSLSLLSDPAISGALFVLGAGLTQYPIRQAWKTALMISLAKLIVLPIAVFSFAKWGLMLNELEVTVVTLMSASPLGVNAYLVARQLNTQQGALASSVALSTLLSVITLSIWLTLLIP